MRTSIGTADRKCIGSARLFHITQVTSTTALSVSCDIIYQRLHYSELHDGECYFLDNTNHTSYSRKCMGALVALCTEKNNQLGFVVAIDKSFKIAICNDSSCFFTCPTKPVSSYFNHIRCISFDHVFDGKFMLFYLNQLNGYRCFQNCCPTNVPDCVISSFDGRFNCNPDGCDTFKYDSYKNDTLYRVRLKDCAQSLIDITPSRTKKPKYKGFRERHLFRYNIHEGYIISLLYPYKLK